MPYRVTAMMINVRTRSARRSLRRAVSRMVRRVMVQIARGDDCFRYPDAALAAEHLVAFYEAAGARDALELHVFDGVHEIDVEPALEFFERTL